MPRLPLLAVIAAPLLAAACDSHPNVTFATPTPNDDGLSLLYTSPASDARDIDAYAQITAVFSKPLDPSSVNASTFTLSLAGAVLDATLAVDGEVATLTPDAPLDFLRLYAIDLTAGVTSLDGQPLDTSHSFTFGSRDLAWEPTQQIGPNLTSGYSNSPVLRLEGEHSIASWDDQFNDGGPTFRRAWVAVGNELGWTDAVLLASSSLLVSDMFPRPAIAEDGSAVVAWLIDDGADQTVHAALAFDGSWSAPVTLNTSTSLVERPDTSIDAQGNSLVVWQQGQSVVSRRFVVGTGWLPMEVLTQGQSVDQTRVVSTPNGRAVAVWRQEDLDFEYHLTARVFEPGSGWGPIERIDADIATSSFGAAKLVVSSDGGVWVSWLDDHIWVNRLSEAGAWGIAQQLSSGGQVSSNDIAEVGNGSIVAWQERNAAMVIEVRISTCDSAGLCSAAATVGPGYSPQIEGDAAGRALLAFTYQTGAVQPIHRLSPDLGWIVQPSPIESDPSDVALALSRDGDGIVLWADVVDGRIRVRRFR